MASRAFTARFTITCSIIPGSASIQSGSTERAGAVDSMRCREASQHAHQSREQFVEVDA
jgi:hypothetical protein